MPDAAAINESRERVGRWAEGLTAALSAADLEVRTDTLSEEPESVTVRFAGPDAHYLVGRHGHTLDALQLLASFAAGARRGGAHIVCDADDYRAHRAETLRSLARELAAEVRETGQEAVLDPLSPLERRIIHTTLVDDPDVRTYSEGEEPRRYIIISPRT